MQARDALRWDDVRLFLALTRESSLARAGARFGFDASTVSRRVAALETRLGVALFHRTRDGMRVTAAGERLVAAAEAMELEAARFTRDAESFERAIEGSVRISAVPLVADNFLAPLVAELCLRYPALTIEVDSSSVVADLTRREADIALRTTRPTAGDLVHKRVVVARSVPLGAPSYVEELGTLRDLAQARWITWTDARASSPQRKWLYDRVPEIRPALLTDSITLQLRAAAAGVGLVLAPPQFAAIFGIVPARVARALAAELGVLPGYELWLVGHRALRDVPRVRAVWTFLEEAIASEPDGVSR